MAEEGAVTFVHLCKTTGATDEQMQPYLGGVVGDSHGWQQCAMVEIERDGVSLPLMTFIDPVDGAFKWRSTGNGLCLEGTVEIFGFTPTMPQSGELRKCLVCALMKPWGVWDSRTGVTVCCDCRDKARQMGETTNRELLTTLQILLDFVPPDRNTIPNGCCLACGTELGSNTRCSNPDCIRGAARLLIARILEGNTNA